MNLKFTRATAVLYTLLSPHQIIRMNPYLIYPNPPWVNLEKSGIFIKSTAIHSCAASISRARRGTNTRESQDLACSTRRHYNAAKYKTTQAASRHRLRRLLIRAPNRRQQSSRWATEPTEQCITEKAVSFLASATRLSFPYCLISPRGNDVINGDMMEVRTGTSENVVTYTRSAAFGHQE